MSALNSEHSISLEQRKFLAECAGFRVIPIRDVDQRERRYVLDTPDGLVARSYDWDWMAWDAAWMIMQGHSFPQMKKDA